MPYEWERCHITGDYIRFGEWYLKDDVDGLIVSAKVYAQAKEEKRRKEWDYSRLERAQNEREYEQMIQEADREAKMESLLRRPVEGRYGY